LAARGQVGRASVIPTGLSPGSDVGNMSIFGYDPARFHTGRAPIEAASLGLKLQPDQVAYRCNLVTLGADGTMVDFAGGHPTSRAAEVVIHALQDELGGEVSFHPGVEYRHIVVAPAEWADAECTPPHDLSDKPAIFPRGAAAPKLRALMDASRDVLSRFGLAANHIWLWGQGFQPQMPAFDELYGVRAALTSAVDLVRGLGVLTNIEVIDVPGATAGYDNDYVAQRDAALHALEGDVDLCIIHVEATDEAGHAGDVAEKIRSLELWDSDILRDLVAGLDALGPWRMLLLPDHATPIRLKTHTPDPVPYLLFDSRRDGAGGEYTERSVADAPVVVGHELMAQLVAAR
jgi:2,3-bisphosphoglycerate-independent phosphoglycerate mutase